MGAFQNPYKNLFAGAGDKVLLDDTTVPCDPAASARVAAVARGSRGVVCEIGSGSGGHLIGLAKRSPNVAHVGVELRFKRSYRTLEKAAREGLDNLYMARTHAANLTRLFPPGALDALYVHFPDPWDKRRWHKNRMVGKRLFDEAALLLKPGGLFSFKTDHPGYFRAVLEETTPEARFDTLRLTEDLYRDGVPEGTVISEFESLFLSKKQPVSHLLLRRRAT